MQGTYRYDPETNEVILLDGLTPWDEFCRSDDRNLFRVSNDDDSSSIMATNGDTMNLKGVTHEQIVILFTTVRGLKEAAEE